MTEPAESEQKLLDYLDGRGSDVEWRAIQSLQQLAGARLPELLLEKYRSSRLAGPRSSCVYHATKFARASEDAVQLGLEAMNDRSKVVRHRALGLLAYSQRRNLLDHLRTYLNTVDEASRADLLAAMDAHEQGNHHLFVDRERSGKVTWNIAEN
jgi:HEAT repeat protein